MCLKSIICNFNIFLSQEHKDLISTLLFQMWRFVAGPLTLFLIPIFLSEVEQGYWYLFVSLSALSVFADLGFSNIILQFSAHEFAFLSFNSKGLIEGDDFHLTKLSSFFRFTLKWISIICLIVFPIIYIIGVWYLYNDDVIVKYILPWTIYSLGALLNFFCYSILSYIEGLNKVELTQNIRLITTIINTIIVASLLMLGVNIYALAFGLLISSIITSVLILYRFHTLFFQLLSISKVNNYGWRNKVLPLFSKYVLSFSSGYFIFNAYTPLMHYFHGPAQSGKVGISLALATTFFNMSNIWIYTITPRINMLVSTKNKTSLDLLFNKRLLYAIITYITMVGGLFIFIAFFKNFWFVPNIIDRFLPLQAILMLLTCYFLQLIINSWAIYLRAHKREPYMIPSIILAFWIIFTTVYTGYNLAPDYFFVGFLSSFLWWLPVTYLIYIHSQRNWYEQ